MNKIYKLIWNAREHAYVVTSELARKSGKVVGVKVLTLLGALALSANVASAAEDLVISDKDKVNGEDTAFIGNISTGSANPPFEFHGLENGQNIKVELERKGKTGSVWGLNDGTGEITVNIKGDVISSGNTVSLPPEADNSVTDGERPFDNAISINNSERSKNLTVNQSEDSSIKGKNTGIITSNSGIGSTNINVAGNVSSTGNITLPLEPENPDSERYNSGSGIIAINNKNATDLNITQSSAASLIQGGATGITASNSGVGSTTITTAGTVIADGIAENGIGIAASNTQTAKAIHINQTSGNIKGKEKGISASNFGQGNTEITTAGNVTGDKDAGIDVTNMHFNYPDAETRAESKSKTDIIINQTAGSIIGGTDGISLVNATGGKVSVTTAGKVEGKTGAGVQVVSGTAPVSDIDENGEDISSAFAVIKKAATKAGDENSQVSLGRINVVQSSGEINGFASGIDASNHESGATNIQVSGNVSATGTQFQEAEESEADKPETDKPKIEYGTGIGIIAVNDGKDTTDLNISQLTESSKIEGTAGGISARNSGSGSTTITTAGTVTAKGPGEYGSGISAFNGETANAITITQSTGEIKGDQSGILATNMGKGSTVITTAANVTGTKGAGIQANNISWNDTGAKTEIKVDQTAGNIIGGTDGISLVNETSGKVSVTTAGKVEGKTGAGIQVVSGTAPVSDIDESGEDTSSAFALNKKVATKAGDENGQAYLGGINIVQQSGEIKGVASGIDANNYESGAVNIQVSGNVSATGTQFQEADKPETEYGTGIGINALNDGENTTDLNISQLAESSKILGTAGGISANNFGIGSTSITTVGTVIATGPGEYGSGISAFNGETANAITITQTRGEIKGDQNGILATNTGKGSTVITTAANVTGTKGAGIQANNINWSDTGAKTDIKVDQTAGNITGGTDGITAVNATGGNITVGVAGKVTGGSGAGIATNIPNGIVSSTTEKNAGISNITLNRGADVSAVSGVAIIDGDNDANVILNGGSKVAGQINLGKGNDTLTINNGSDISGVTVLDGGNDNDTGPDSSTDKLYLNTSLRGSSETSRNGEVGIINWEDINLGESATLTLTGNLNTQNLNIGSGSELKLDNVSKTASDDYLQEVTVKGNVKNSGSINMVNGNVGDRLTIQGNYHGEKGSKLLMEVTPEQNQADKLHITGDATGTTAIDLTEVSGLGDNTAGTNGVEIVSADGKADGEVFTLLRDHVDAGAYEYRLKKSEDNKWNLLSEKIPDTGNKTKPKTAYRKEVPLLSAVGAQLRQADSLMLADMHKRIGATPAPDERKAWGRVIANRSDIRQSGVAHVRSKGNYAGLQLGSDVWTNNGLRVGGYLGYLHGNLDVDGFASGVDGKVGKNSTKSYFLGAYGNYTRDSGTYLDVVLQGARHNADIKPNNASDSKQKGHGITASVEVGQPFALGSSSWKFEPQAQIMHQWLDLNDIDISGNTKVRQDHDNAWLFRLGGRLEGNYSVNKGVLRPYARLNFFYSPNGADTSSFATKAASTTLRTGASHANTEMAIGGSYEITDKVKAYGEIGHTWSNGNDAHVKSPVNGSVGLRVNW
ncbi:autotransporter outer membrane beta-barrel domain-containing protein [Snodgrassella alvi]|uniref:autotransporter outer membrane beta-barrel domain-containing protein n=1 Tax=Snodgrassella alvi TaxID=1196083 RepID=UPI00352C5175